ncbi:PREDICTED: von Willebrand factor A domain-containing protein 8 [Nicrophorus vespilloides]|uniref:von Willebrand factor A domain-containing protein 8 n=1 Tax=Nicrophorus vespilloides TaxID=110193 RepID=A0ABM1MV40_NICVS|nr:PREDICTED: von Willebrand factor A domain-containing protein 8 [Nicrophorus vespilloides]
MMQGAANRRLNVLLRCLQNPNKENLWQNVRTYVSSDTVSIGGITKDVKKVKLPQYVPRKYYDDNAGQSTLHHLRWMMQKDILGQDVFLLGPPGPRRRNLAMQYLELTNREHEYVALSRDTTESDLKQRREIMQGTASYFDQSAVRAATEGRVLILEGIEKAERNVLPVLNNLLENREMHLEDGRLLIPAERYDKLLEKFSKDDLEKWKLVRVDEGFRVIALGLPVPRYRGNPLDPPLRSRFQARDVNINNYQEWLQELKTIAPGASVAKLEQLLSAAFGLISKESSALGLPDFPIDNLPFAAKLLEKNPRVSVYDILYRMYPYKIFLKDGFNSIESLLASFQVIPDSEQRLPANNLPPGKVNYVDGDYQNRLIGDMLESNSVADFCIIGPRGCGKSILVDKMADILGKQVESIVLYQDMTSRELIQQRTTLENGDTVWKFSPLINAALEGKIAVLDGLHRIHPSTLSVLHRLVHDREIQLHDGKRMVNNERYEMLMKEFNLTEQEMVNSGVLKIHPDFRIVAIAEPPTLTSGANWLSPEVLSLFIFHEARTLSKQEEMKIITSQYGPISKPLHQIINLAHVLRDSPDPTLKNLSGHLSTRQLLRIASRMQKFPTDDAYDTIEKTFMAKFLPSLAREALEKTLDKVDILPNMSTTTNELKCEVVNDVVTIGKTSIPLYKTDSLTKVPNILFYDVPQHIHLMERLLQDFQLGQHLLLVGNQGVGKNKIVDRFLQLLNRPREYIQLHRDTTVQTLTIQPTVKDGLLVYEDSPLVKAIKFGHVLVIDEADKAPTHVTCILKTLVETGEMILSDGRRIVKTGHDGPNCIPTHPDFRIIVLANRPGFPFLGNDFFGALGDLFSSHAVDNPSALSEVDLLQQYGPNVPQATIRKLVDVFGELRTMADQGLVNYPYSTREVVNIVKHLQQFPKADLEDVLFNVFDFDRYSPEMVETVGQVLTRFGFPNSNVFTTEYIKAKQAKEHIQVTKSRHSGLDNKAPKHGKEDPKNEPHVGGNTWAGGTGGRDTAGLGGKGGPYRLDKGHDVHQLSDEEKAAVPEHIQRAAREMGKQAFEAKLKEIGMSGYDASLYNQFSKSVSKQVQSLRVVLSTLQAKNKERHWNRHQTSGELDDVKLIDGILGEKTIYRRRSEQEPELGTPQIKPKMFRLVVDVSGSMYRFNSYDGRLERELEAVVLVMEAFEGFEDKITYDIIGHSGETDRIEFVKKGEPPKNNMERLNIVRVMHAHSQYCWSGDHTLEATEHAVNSLSCADNDESIVVVLSDANLARYGISPAKLGKALTAQPDVSAYAVFIGGLGDQAERLTQFLPAGRAFVCTDLSKLPQILKQIFSSSLVTPSS